MSHKSSLKSDGATMRNDSRSQLGEGGEFEDIAMSVIHDHDSDSIPYEQYLGPT